MRAYGRARNADRRVPVLPRVRIVQDTLAAALRRLLRLLQLWIGQMPTGSRGYRRMRVRITSKSVVDLSA